MLYASNWRGTTANIGVSRQSMAGMYTTSAACDAVCGISAIDEYIIHKELLKVTDLLGRETKHTNQPLLYLYDDGTVEKKIVIE